MSVRFRKSKKVGPFRFTVSKSGISTSVGVKGFRVTKTASGKTRVTASVPGTGLSWSEQVGGKKAQPAPQQSDRVEVKAAPIPEKPEIEGKGMKKYIAKLTKGSRWAIGIVLVLFMTNLAQVPSDIALIFSGLLAVAFLVFLSFCLKIKPAPTQKDLERQRLAVEAEEARREAEENKRRIEEEHAAKTAEKAEWERTHGRIFTKVVGVTFKNEDGSDRQSLLKEFAASADEHDVELEVYDFEGEEAIRVKWEGYCLGHVPKKTVPEIIAVEDRIDIIRMDVETFTPDDSDDDFDDDGRRRSSNGKLYRADLTIVYSKE